MAASFPDEDSVLRSRFKSHALCDRLILRLLFSNLSLQRGMHGRFRKKNADSGHHEQNKQYLKSRSVAAANIAHVSGEGRPETADKGIEGHCVSHNLGGFRPAVVVGIAVVA